MLSRNLLSLSLLSFISMFITSSLAMPTPQFPRAEGAVSLKIQPLGASITSGKGSTNGNGYREELLNSLKASPSFGDVSYIGSLKAGTMVNNENEGHAGIFIADTGAFAAISMAQQPNLILLLIGSNDMTRGKQSGAPQRLEALIDQLIQAAPTVGIIVANLPPMSTPAVNDRKKQFNTDIAAMIDQKAASGQKVMSVDMDSAMDVRELVDDVHPTDAGYSKMAKVWAAGIETAVGKGWFI